jgi:hypothetical protein
MTDGMTARERAMFEAGKQKAENTLTGRALLISTVAGVVVGVLLSWRWL